ncbi:cupredoxin domain-containing protein [Beijerinckia indica]|uniref:Blue (Type 1) copper domain protein n=1 Tax=Beijerinckia indica subsp. indica (strain ATCC 9039 / DSM 1715 / NCIMB 8712) TaxID=395963 RepID=B2IDE2_BEII9|nr:cupredoxin domain-containing protein [Beijerinckia indica]ACB93994.1 blue (type 1) copper domain protein [Beijerinckia indica subsp. indica ATCC 9039]
MTTLSFSRARLLLPALALAFAMTMPGLTAIAAPDTTKDPVKDAAANQAVTVVIDNFTFTPATVTVTPGTTVTFVNHDDIPHTVVETKHLFRSKVLDSDDTFSFTFDKDGVYDFFCSLHPHMTGKIVVETR